MNYTIHDKSVCVTYTAGIYCPKALSKILLIMKLAAILTLLTCLNLRAAVYSQQISLSVKNASLEKVIKQIRQQSGYAFFYDSEYLQRASPVTVEVKNVSVEEALLKTFSSQPFTWEILDKTILIKPASVKGMTMLIQTNDIKGKITDANGETLPGATVKIKGTTIGTVTDVNGNFTLKSVKSDAILIVSYTGFVTREIPVKGQRDFAITLEVSSQTLEELVVIGYGTQKKRDLTGAVSSVKAADLVVSQGPEVGNMLKGKVAGLTIRQNSAQPGGGLDILVRGAGSVNASNEPLFVVDGFPISDLQQPGTGNRYDGGTQSMLNSFNPNDIESIEVLKDASATSIYGSRAANGVILITTKRGKEGKTKVDYSNNFSFQKWDNSFEVLPLNEWMQVRNDARFEKWMWDNEVTPYGSKTLAEAEANPKDGRSYQQLYTQNAINNVGRGTDWFNLVMRNGKSQQHNISLSGGSKTTRYLLSGNYFGQDGVVKNSKFNRYSMRANIDQEITKYIKVGLNLTSSRIDNDNTQLGGNNWENSGILRAAIQMGPHIPAIDEDGNYPINPELPLQPNPASLLTVSDKGRIERMLLNTFVDIKPINDLTIRLKAGMDRGYTKRSTYLPRTTIHGALEGGRASISNLDKDDYLLEATANYTKTFGDGHKFELLGGASRQKFIENSGSSAASGFITDAFLWNNLNAGSLQLPSSSYRSENMIASYFSRLNYNYKSKYLFTFTIRTDGSSIFARNHKWATFPSAAIAWNVAEEPFLQNIKNTVSQLKVRFSYGQTGNATISSAALDKFGSVVSNAFPAYSAYPGWLSKDDARMIAVSLSRLENPDLKWETTTGANLGIDYSLFNGKVEGSVELYNNVISDLLDTKFLNSYNEVNQVIANVGKTRSRGIEVSVSTRNIQRKDFQWRTTANFSLYRDNWLERAPDWKPSVYENAKDPIRPIYTRLSDGILQIGEPIPAAQPNLKPGQVKIRDINGFKRDGAGIPVVDENGRFQRTGQPDGIIDEADNVLLGTSDPGYMVGLTNIIKYKKFSLNFDFNGLLGRKMIDPNFQIYGYSAYGIADQGYNALTSVKNRWTPTNPSTTVPSSFADSSPDGLGDFLMQDAWFIRLQNVSLGYDLPTRWLKGTFSSARINVSAYNLFVISPYTGVDPETDSYTAAYPNVRTFTAGLNITF
ncbi:TonB-dependent receptor (plasmid) [Pedobacter sp. BS3]|uniref:TonB-dependent receptor n=1 Tax=Pedobacter sp. BS3 TaxID=2567937 RepID=UPI0011EE061E|nr:TonB-dependent receptor [Pedobacter sp. BS3]TZF85693.1 TonB-dependent receptor [Pedobacter sp. BS3]